MDADMFELTSTCRFYCIGSNGPMLYARAGQARQPQHVVHNDVCIQCKYDDSGEVSRAVHTSSIQITMNLQHFPALIGVTVLQVDAHRPPIQYPTISNCSDRSLDSVVA